MINLDGEPAQQTTKKLNIRESNGVELVEENIDEYAFLLEENLNAMTLIEDEGKKWEKIEKEISQKQE